MAGVPGAQTLGHQHLDIASNQLVAREAKLPLYLGIDHHDLAVVVNHYHSAWAGFHSEPEHLLRETESDHVLRSGDHPVHPIIRISSPMT